MQPPEPETNPYQTPGIERLHHTSVYQWPLAADKSFSFEVNIDKDQLLKCVAENHQLVGFNVLATLILAISFLLTGIILLSYAGGTLSAFICLASFIGLCYLAPRCSHSWHARRLIKQFSWMWGPVRVTIDSNGVLWKSESVELRQHWDSFHQLTWWQHTATLSTLHPFAMELPIHRDWVDEAVWGDLFQIAESHKGFFNKQIFWKMVNRSVVSFKEAAAPDQDEIPTGAISFRASGLGGWYGCEATSFLSQQSKSMVLFPFMIMMFGSFIPYGRDLDKMFGITENGYHMYLFYTFLLISNSLATVTGWLPAGPGFFQRSQTLVSSQSGYVSPDRVRVASPASSLTAKIGGDIFLRQEKDCLVLQLQRKFAQSLVIPRDQFASETVDSAWQLFST